MKTLTVFLPGLVLSLLILAVATENFQVATAEGARRLEVARHPVSVPDVIFEDMDGRKFSLSDYEDETVLVEFIYTTCPTLCQVMGEKFAGIQDFVRTLPEGQKVRMLSVSFDLRQDDPAALRDYAERYNAKGDIWKIVRPTSQGDLDRLLELFGVTVIPDPDFGFQHNAAIHVVDGSRRLVRIMDIETANAVAFLRQKQGGS